MRKLLTLLSCCTLIFASSVLTSCDKDDEGPNKKPLDDTTSHGLFVVNQGNYYNGITGSLDFLNTDNGTYTNGVFAAANNGQSLGDTPETAVIYGSNLYVAIYASSVVQVINKDTHTLINQIKVTSPQSICATNGCVFITEGDGHVACIDTTTMSVAKRAEVEVPFAIVASNGKLYVNSNNASYNGTTVAVFDAATLTLDKNITVGINPYDQMAVDGQGNVFTVCSGDYSTVMPAVWKISPDGTAKKYCNGSIIACGANCLYVIDSVTDWTTYETTTSYTCYLTTTDEQLALPLSEKPASPVAMAVNPKNGNLYITSDAALYDYNTPGYLYEYNASGTLLKRYGTGSHPYYVVFKN